MRDLFLKAKHWQLFLLTFALPLFFYFLIMGFMVFDLVNQTIPDPTTMLNYMKYFPLIMMLSMAVTFGWIWSVTIGLQNKVPENVTIKTTKFKIFFFISLAYTLLFLIFFNITINELIALDFESDFEPDFGFIPGLFLLMFPLHLFAIFCIFYTYYLMAKTYKTVELQRNVTFDDFVGEFFLIMFYPIGVWFIQPKINKMIDK